MKQTAQSRQARVLHELLQEQGLVPGAYRLFFVTGEGRFLPTSAPDEEAIEAASGFVIDRNGRVFFFWLDWDPVQERPALTEWEEQSPDPDWVSEEEYQDARRMLGLAA